MATEPIVYQFQTTGADKLISAVKNINQENETLARFLRELQSAFNLSAAGAAKYAKTLGITGNNLVEFQRAQANAANSAKTLAASQGNVTKALQNTDEAAKALSKQFLATAGSQATSFLRKTADDALDAARRYNGLQSALTTVSGSTEKAAENFAFIRGEVNRLGLDLEKSTSGFNKLVASTKDVELSKELFTGINEAASALQLSADDTSGVVTALTQIASKGVVSMEELRQQLGERLPGAFQLAAKSAGLTEAEFTKLVSTGDVKAIPFLKKFAPALSEAFGSGALRNAESLNAQFNRVNTALFDLAQTVGNAIAPAFKLVADGIISATDAFKSLPTPIQQGIIVLTGLSIGLVAVAGVIAALSLASTALSPVLAGLFLSLKGFTAAGFLAGIINGIGGIAIAAKTTAVALGPLALAFAALYATISIGQNIARVVNFDKSIENLQELQRGLDASGDAASAAGLRTNRLAKELETLADSGKKATASQVKQAEEQIAANKGITESIDKRIAAFTSLLGKEEILDGETKSSITALELEKKSIVNATDALKKQVSQATVARSAFDDLTNAYNKQVSALEAQSASRQATILTNVQDEAKANKQILADDIATSKQRLELTKARIDTLRILEQSLSKSKDGKDIAEREKIEKEITKLVSEQGKQQIDIAKNVSQQRKAVEEKLLADLDAANTKALATVDSSAAFRINAAKRASIGNIQAAESEATAIAKIELDTSVKRLALVTADQAKLKELKGQISGQEFRDRELALETEKSQAILAIAQNETALLAAEQEKRKADTLAQFELTKQAIEANKIKLEFDTTALQIEGQLLEAQKTLVDALAAVKIASIEAEVAAITNASNLRTQYNALDASQTGQKQEILKQLAALGTSIAITDLAAIAKKAVKEAELAAVQKAVLAERQTLELKLFDVKAKQQALSLSILQTEKEIAVIEAQAVASALQAANASAAQLAAARQRVALAQRAFELAQQTANASTQATALAREGLTVDQQRVQQELVKSQSTKATATALEKAKTADAQLAKSSAQVAANTEKSARNAEVLASATEEANKKAAEFAASVGTIRDSLAAFQVGIAGFNGGGSSGLSIKTADPVELLKQRLNLELKLAKTEEEKIAVNEKLAALEVNTAQLELDNLRKKIELNNTLVGIEKEFARARGLTNGFGPTPSSLVLQQALNLLGNRAKAGESIGFKFRGGDVSANEPTVVGEDPRTGRILPSSEMFIPKVSGYVMAAEKLKTIMKAPSIQTTNNASVRSPDYLKKISDGISTLNTKVSNMQPSIEQVNINGANQAPNDIVYKLMSAQIKARK